MLVMGICDIPEVLEVMRIVNIIILIIKIVVPIMLIVSGMVTFMSSIKVGNEDLLAKAKKSLIIKCIAAVCIFLVPTIVNVLVDISGPNDYKACLEADVTTIDKAYENRASSLLAKAESSKKLQDYSNAVTAVNDIKDEETRKSYQNRLNKLYSEIENNMKNNDKNDNSSSGSGSSGSGSGGSNDNSGGSSSGGSSSGNSGSVGTVAGTIFMGDSRTNGLKLNAGLPSTDKVVAKDSGGYNDFVSHISTVNGYLSNDKSYNIVLNYGVNDLGNSSKYCEKYKSFINSVNSNNKVYVVSVNPVRDSGSKYAKNANIKSFNNTIKSCISGLKNTSYCDVYGSASMTVWEDSYISGDSIHYTPNGYKYIYSVIKNCIK